MIKYNENIKLVKIHQFQYGTNALMKKKDEIK